MSIEYKMPAGEYFSLPGLSISTLKRIHPTPAHLRHYLETEREEPSAEMLLGTLIHSAVLQPEEPLPAIAVKTEDINFRTKEGKAWRDEQQKAGRIILTVPEYETLNRCVRSVARNRNLCALFAEGNAEVSVFADFLYGVPEVVKGRLDFVPRNEAVIVDVKTVRDASPDAFLRSVIDHGWHQQAAWYLRLWNVEAPASQVKDGFLWVAIEKETGFVATYYLTDEWRAIGDARNVQDLELYRECKERDDWPAYASQVQPLPAVPRWMKKGDAE